MSADVKDTVLRKESFVSTCCSQYKYDVVGKAYQVLLQKGWGSATPFQVEEEIMDILNPVAILPSYVVLGLGLKWHVSLVPVKSVTVNSLHKTVLLWELISKMKA